MSAFEKIKVTFDTNWTTVLVGWNGLGVLSPWPGRWVEFSPLISPDEIAAYAEERLAFSSSSIEQELIVGLLSSNLRTESRETVKVLLIPLSDLSSADPGIELRKWRLILLEDVLANMPKDPTYGLLALSEFWQQFGFPSDSPHEVQGRGNEINPSEYYQAANLQQLLDRHRVWIQQERSVLKTRTETELIDRNNR